MAAISFYNEIQLIAGRMADGGRIEEALGLLHSGHRFIVECFTPGRTANYPLLNVELSESDFGQIQMKTMANELFVIAHEFAHVFLGHLARTEERPLVAGDGTLEVTAYALSRDMEYEADEQAVRWIAALPGTASGEPGLALATASTSMAVEVLMMVHTLDVNSRVGSREYFHPLAIERMKHIQAVCSPIMRQMDKELLEDMIKNASDVDSFKV